MAGLPETVGAGGAHPALLVDRAGELALLSECLGRLRAGSSGVVVIEGVAGVGKTVLLKAAHDEAAAAGVRVLWARARHLESTVPYELLRRLLGPSVAGRGGPDALTGAAAFAATLFTPGAGCAPGVDYGCQWLLASLADEGPLVLCVDDAHWADAESLRVLADVAEDLRSAPIVIVVTTRPAESPAVAPLLARLATVGEGRLVRPEPLTMAGVAAVVSAAFQREPHRAFVQACARVSGGNAFYLRELVRPLVSAGVPPDEAAAGELDATGPDALARTLRARLGELGEVALGLAQAAAVLGDDSTLRDASALARIDLQQAGVEATRLVAAAILTQADPIVFLHPLIRSAVEQGIAPGRIGALHARAARLLFGAGAPARQVVQHLVVAPPAASPAAVELLKAEAGRDLASGSASVANQLLRRALAEPPAPSARPGVLLALAQSERAVGEPANARAHLTEVVETGTRETAISAMADLFELYYEVGDRDGAARLQELALAAEPYGDSPSELRLRAVLLDRVATGIATQAPAELFDFDIDNLPIDSGESRRLLIAAAIYRRAIGDCPPREFVAHLRRAVQALPSDRDLSYWEVQAALESAAFLASVEAMDDSEVVLDRLRPDVARLRGASPDLQAEWTHRTVLNAVRRGRFEDALTQLAEAEQFADRHGLAVYRRLAHYARGCVHLERGDYREAGRHFLAGPADDGPIVALGDLLSGRPAQALKRLELDPDEDAPATELEIEFEPHLIASHAHESLGDRERALREADRELAVRRVHGPSFRLALALRRRASFATPRDAVVLLDEAKQVCAATARLPVRARVQASYGAALRRASRLRDARVELAAALDLADRLGMTRLRRRVSDELRAAGGRTRRMRMTGALSLTEGQATVARLAASGRTNREIAEGLYVSVKTVETHLAAVYRKLSVPGRDHLVGALADSSR